jgi:hypothetical protein
VVGTTVAVVGTTVAVVGTTVAVVGTTVAVVGTTVPVVGTTVQSDIHEKRHVPEKRHVVLTLTETIDTNVPPTIDSMTVVAHLSRTLLVVTPTTTNNTNNRPRNRRTAKEVEAGSDKSNSWIVAALTV